MADRKVISLPSAAPYRMEAIGAERARWRDLYHAFLRTTWPRAIGLILVAFAALNLFFGTLFYWSQGVANAKEGSFFDAFSFSVQTLATIG